MSGPKKVNITLSVKCLADVKPEKVSWLWPARVPFGKLTLIEGDPGLGKSTTTTEVAARLSRGDALPGGEPTEPMTSLFVTYEDGLADTIKPRIIAAGGDDTRVYALEGAAFDNQPEHMISIPGDVEALKKAIQVYDVRFVVIDPLGAAFSTDKDSHKDSDARSALAPLARMAEETNCAVVIVRHLNKSTSGRAITAGGGSIGFAGAARSVLAVHADPTNPEGRILAVVKNNLAKHAPSLAFGLEDTGDGCARIVWRGESDLSAEQLTASRAAQSDEEDDASEIDLWLREYLSEGERDRKDVLRNGKEAGFVERTIDRAKRRIGVTTKMSGFGAAKRSIWSMPANPANSANPAIGFSAGADAIPTMHPPHGEHGGIGGIGGNGGIEAPSRPRKIFIENGREILKEQVPTAHGDEWRPVTNAA